jgi:hypothetical protein
MTTEIVISHITRSFGAYKVLDDLPHRARHNYPSS